MLYKNSFLSLIVLMFLASPIAPTSAIEGGKSALSENVVTFVLRDLTKNTLSRPTCSGGMIAPRIVVTAKHCLKGLIDSKWEVTFPGADIESKDLITSRIVKIIARPGEFTTEDDIALIVIDRDFPVTQNLKVANREDMIRLRNLEPPSLTYGYGSTATSNLQTYLPFKIENKLVRDFPDKNWSSLEEVFAIKYLSPSSYICGGDSGGPNYVWSGEFLYFIGPTGFATRPGCEKGLQGSFYLGGTAIAYKLDLLQEAEIFVEKSKAEELSSAAQQKGSKNAEDHAAEELKAKQEPVMKAAVNAKKTITCFKDKVTKKVTAVKPKCPRGFKTKK